MSAYVRRFTFDPGSSVLLNIESVNILDLTPPAALQGIGSGTTLLVGEFENGPYNFNLEIDSAQALQRQYGTLGYVYNGVQCQNPSAIARKADNATSPEYWNGNAFVQLNGKQYSRLILCRVNTSVGTVQLSKLASITGTAAAIKYNLGAGSVLSLDLGAGPVSATFSAAVAAVTGSGAAFGSLVAGNQVTLGYDGAPNFTVTFQSTDTTISAVLARINQFAGFTFASNTGGQLTLTGLQAGNAGQVRVVSDNASGAVITDLGLTVATTLGTGNVGNAASVSQSEVQAVVQAAVANSKVEFNSSSQMRISNTGTTPFIRVTSATSAAVLSAFGFTVGQIGTVQGQAILVSGTVSGTMPASTLVLGVDAQPNVTITFAGTEATVANKVSAINAAFVAVGQPGPAVADGASNLYLTSTLQNTTAAQVRVVAAGSSTVLSDLGLTLGVTQGATALIGTLPAGTVVQVPGATQGNIFVTAQDVNFTTLGVFVGGTSTAGGGTTAPVAGPFNVPIRHALDDGSGTSAGAGAITLIATPPAIGAFACTNLAPTSAALTETQIDAAYVTALNATVDVNTVAKQANIIFSARQSNTIRSAMRSNAISASTGGCFGRVACIRPPLNTAEATALGAAAPGVQATRDERTLYCYIGSNVYVPLIAAAGMAANPPGTGYVAFTPDGNVNVGSDSLLASVMSQLNPEENPGQDTPFATVVNGIETNPNVQGFQIGDYIAFKAAGICALRIDNGVAAFQSGVTSVDPGIYPQLATIARRRMADFIQDSLAQRAKSYSKKLNTFARRQAFANEVTQFLESLLSRNNPSFQRIGGYTVNTKVNTVDSLGIGIFRLHIDVQTLSSMDSIVLETVIGTQVTVTQSLPQAA